MAFLEQTNNTQVRLAPRTASPNNAPRQGGSVPRTPVAPPPAPQEAFVTEKVAPGDNMWIWAQVQRTPPNACKDFTRAGGFSGTNINAMYRIKKLTEVFGPVGIGWYTTNHKYTIHPCPATGEAAVMCELYLIVKDPFTGEWSQPVFGVGGNLLFMLRKGNIVLNDEGYKMAYTDAIGVACKAFGFSADIYWSADRTKYDLDMELNNEGKPLAGQVAKDGKAFWNNSPKPKGTQSNIATRVATEGEDVPFEEEMKQTDKALGRENAPQAEPPRDTFNEIRDKFAELRQSPNLKPDAVEYEHLTRLLEMECAYLTGQSGEQVMTEAINATNHPGRPNMPLDVMSTEDLAGVFTEVVAYVKQNLKK